MGFLFDLVFGELLDWLLNRAPRPVAIGCVVLGLAIVATVVVLIWVV